MVPAWGLTLGRGHTLTCLAAGAVGQSSYTSSPCGVGFLTTWRLGSKSECPERRGEGVPHFRTSSCKSGYLTRCILSVRNKSLRPAHIQGRRIKSPPTDGKTAKEFANIF